MVIIMTYLIALIFVLFLDQLKIQRAVRSFIGLSLVHFSFDLMLFGSCNYFITICPLISLHK